MLCFLDFLGFGWEEDEDEGEDEDVVGVDELTCISFFLSFFIFFFIFLNQQFNMWHFLFFFKWLITHMACQINVDLVKIDQKDQSCKEAKS